MPHLTIFYTAELDQLSDIAALCRSLADTMLTICDEAGKPAFRHFEPLFASRYIGLTLQIDEGAEVFNVKHSTIRPLFTKS